MQKTVGHTSWIGISEHKPEIILCCQAPNYTLNQKYLQIFTSAVAEKQATTSGQRA